jgi:hypothetical protein
MAEKVKRRVAAARLAVAFVAAGTIAGATAWAQAGPPPPTAEESAAYLKSPKVTGDDVVNGSLFLKDFHKGEVASSDAFLKYKKATTIFKKSTNANIFNIKGELSNIKGELGDIKLDIDTVKGELVSGYLKSVDADSRYLKLSDAVVRGDGSVFNAIKEVSNSQQVLVPLISVPGMIDVAILSGEQDIRITNTGSSDLLFSACSGALNGGTLQPGQSVTCNISAQSEVMQLIGAGGGSTVATLNFSALPAVQVNATKYIIAILVGM